MLGKLHLPGRKLKRLLTELHIGQNATLRVPEFDRDPSDPRNLLVVILEKNNDFYEVGCREGRMINKYTRKDKSTQNAPVRNRAIHPVAPAKRRV